MTAVLGQAGAAPMTGVPRLRLGQLLRLSWQDLWHERGLACCAACVLAATLAPLWTLWGLERGVIGTLIERQDSDPLMRELVPAASGGAASTPIGSRASKPGRSWRS